MVKQIFEQYNFAGGLNNSVANHLIGQNEVAGILNMDLDVDGDARASKRYKELISTAISANPICGLKRFRFPDGTKMLTCACDTKLYLHSAGNVGVHGKWNEIYDGLTPNQRMRSIFYKNLHIMLNGYERLKFDGNVVSQMGIDPPATAPDVKIREQAADFETDESWSEGVADTVYFKRGSRGLRMTATASNSLTSDLTKTLDLSIPDEFDHINIWTYHFDRANIETIQIQLDCNAGDFATDYYHYTINQGDLEADDNIWTEHSIKKSDFTRVGATSGKNWGTIVKLRIILTASAAGTAIVTLDDWRTIGRGHITGGPVEYIYRVVYLSDTGRSGPSPMSAPAIEIPTDRKAYLYNLPVSTDPQIKTKRIYRRGGSDPLFREVIDILNAVTEYYDSKADEELTFEIQSDIVRPPAGEFIVEEHNKVHIAGNKRYPYRAWRSGYGEPETFTELNAYDVGEAITALATLNEQVYIFTTNSIYLWPDDSPPIRTRSAIGTDSQDGIVNIEDNIVFRAGKKGYYRFDGALSHFISRKIPLTTEDIIKVWDSVYFEHRVWWAVETKTDGNLIHIVDIRTGAWTIYKYKVDVRIFSHWNGKGDNQGLYFGSTDGKVYRANVGYSDNGEEYEWYLATKRYRMGTPRRKWFATAFVEALSSFGTFNLTYDVDNSTFEETIAISLTPVVGAIFDQTKWGPSADEGVWGKTETIIKEEWLDQEAYGKYLGFKFSHTGKDHPWDILGVGSRYVVKKPL